MQFIFLFVVVSPWWTPGLPSAVHLCFFILFVRPASLSDSVQSCCFLCYICLTFESSLFSVFWFYLTAITRVTLGNCWSHELSIC